MLFRSPIGAPMSEGTNRLIQLGSAKLILNADDVLCEFVQRFPAKLGRKPLLPPAAAEQRLEDMAPPSGDGPQPLPQDKNQPKIREKTEYLHWAECNDILTDDQRDILLAMDGGMLRADDLVERTQIPARRVLSALTLLQVQGYVSEESGKRFQAVVKLKME